MWIISALQKINAYKYLNIDFKYIATFFIFIAITIGFYKSYIVIFCQLRILITIDYSCYSTLCRKAQERPCRLFFFIFFQPFLLSDKK